MDYKKNYFDYISYVKTLNRQKGDGNEYERHHIIPKSLGGSDEENNLVLLTCREHFLAHYLLCKFTEGSDKKKMIWAFHRMTYSDYYGTRKIKSSRFYEYIRKKYKEYIFDEKFKNQVSKRVKNTVWVNNGTESKMVKDPIPFLNNGWVYGRLKFKSTSHRGKGKGKRKAVPKRYWMYNETSSTDKMVLWEEISIYESNGWKRGRLQMDKTKVPNPKGRIRVFNPVTEVEKSIYEHELDTYLKLGFLKGRKPVSKETKEKMSKAHSTRRIV